MEVKKCVRCGSFFVSKLDTCDLCSKKDMADVRKIKSCFEESNQISNLNDLMRVTNISEKNIIRLMENNGDIANNNILGNIDNRFNNINL